MKEEDIRQLLREYIVSTWLSGDSRDFNDETDLAQAGILDSFSTLAMASFIDERFRIRLEPSEINADQFSQRKHLDQHRKRKNGNGGVTLGSDGNCSLRFR
jgi:acyl carrier protein